MADQRLKAIKAALKARDVSSIGAKGIEAIQEETGSKKGVRKAAKSLGIDIKPSAQRREDDFIPKYNFKGVEGRLSLPEFQLAGATTLANITLDLQKIVNAGNQEVENIRGEFGLKGKQIDRGTAVLGGLVNAFNFS